MGSCHEWKLCKRLMREALSVSRYRKSARYDTCRSELSPMLFGTSSPSPSWMLPSCWKWKDVSPAQSARNSSLNFHISFSSGLHSARHLQNFSAMD